MSDVTSTDNARGGLASSVPAVRAEGVVKRFGSAVALDGAGLEVPSGMVWSGLAVQGAEAAQTAGFVVIFPLVFASSVFVPVASMPHWLQAFAKISPVTVTADAARSLALFGTPASLGATSAWIGGLLAVFIPLSVWRYRRMS
jgi:ABC-type multidrug transport system permease subunit